MNYEDLILRLEHIASGKTMDRNLWRQTMMEASEALKALVEERDKARQAVLRSGLEHSKTQADLAAARDALLFIERLYWVEGISLERFRREVKATASAYNAAAQAKGGE